MGLPVGVALAVLGLAVLVLVGLSLGTARRPAAEVPTRAGYLRLWSGLHGGYDPAGSRVAAAWLALVYAAARPLARRGVPPDVLTLWGLTAGGGVLVAAAAGGRWALLAAAVVVLSGLLDGLDGCVAVLTGRASRFGAVLDSLVDRGTDGCYLLALWALGADGRLCVAAGSALGLLEYTRALAAAAGMPGIGVVTVAERGTRVGVTAAVLAGCGLLPARAAAAAGLGAAAVLGLCAAGLVQLLVVVRRELRPAR